MQLPPLPKAYDGERWLLGEIQWCSWCGMHRKADKLMIRLIRRVVKEELIDGE
jgi:hypothetical protein